MPTTPNQQSFVDILPQILAKKAGQALSEKDLYFVVDNFVKDRVSRAQMAAFLMAVNFQGMTDEETYYLTKIFLESSHTYHLPGIKGFKIEKHSTGGVGDKMTLIFGPLISSFGLKLPKMSGRSLSFTGGTIDKISVFPGMKTELTSDELTKIVNEVGFAITATSNDVNIADKKVYELRNLTGTAGSIPLIVASIMSKKLSIEFDWLILDVTWGSGSFLKTKEEAIHAAKIMESIGEQFGRKNITAVVTNMNEPAGFNVGTLLEIEEAITTLNGNGPKDVVEIVTTLAGEALLKAGKFKTLADAKKACVDRLNSKTLVDRFKAFVLAQGGDWDAAMKMIALNPKPALVIKAKKDGYLTYTDTAGVGLLARTLSCTTCPDDTIKTDPQAGIKLKVKTGDKVKVGQPIMELYTNKTDPKSLQEFHHLAEATFKITTEKSPEEKPIAAIISIS